MTTSNEHNNAPAVPQGEPVAWQARCVWPNGRKSTKWSLVTARNAELTPKMRAEYLARLTHPDGSPSYEVRALYAATPAPAPAQYKDSTLQLSVGESSFEYWFESYNPANKGDKQRARDAYAAGMGDPLVTVTPAQEVVIHQGYEIHELPPDYSGPVWIESQVRQLARQTACASQPTTDTEVGAQEVGLTDEEIEAIAQKHMSTVGDHWCNEDAIRERHAEDFARAIIAALRAKGQS